LYWPPPVCLVWTASVFFAGLEGGEGFVIERGSDVVGDVSRGR